MTGAVHLVLHLCDEEGGASTAAFAWSSFADPRGPMDDGMELFGGVSCI